MASPVPEGNSLLEGDAAGAAAGAVELLEGPLLEAGVGKEGKIFAAQEARTS